jgi:hypothetical protein
MVIYEVNLTVNNEIFEDYYQWLIKHVEEMFQFRGFKKAEIAKEKKLNQESEDKTKLTVRYSIDNEADLNDYLQNFATTMREAAIKKFGDKFRAERRIFTEPLEVVI